jgi:DNA-binding NarL/FixJ family response regulator
MTAIRVLVVDADPLARQALGELLATEQGLEVVATAADTEAGVIAVEELDVDVVLMDASLSCEESLSAIERIHEASEARGSHVAVLILSTANDHELGLRALRHNAAGFLSKDVPIDALGRIVHSLARGEVVITRAMTTMLVAQLRALGPPRGLTPPRRVATARGVQEPRGLSAAR